MTSSSEGHPPPKGVQQSAQRAVQWIEDDKAGANFTEVGRHRAHQLAQGQALSDDDVKKMKAYFARHEVDKKAAGFTGAPTATPPRDGSPGTPGEATRVDAGWTASTSDRQASRCLVHPSVGSGIEHRRATVVAVEPIPESVEAVEEFGPFEPELLRHLQDRAAQVQDLVPDCVGVSLASFEHGATFTVVATDEEIAALDGVQYVDDGPCVEAVRVAGVLEFEHDMLAEAGWQLFAQATSATSVASTLTLPIVADEQVVGSVNLYAATPRAFTGHHEEIARIFGAWAPGAVTNADLDFSTRRTSQQAPQLLHAQTRIQVAAGMLAAARRISLEAAVAQLSDAARRAGVSEAAIAETLIGHERDGRAERRDELDDRPDGP